MKSAFTLPAALVLAGLTGCGTSTARSSTIPSPPDLSAAFKLSANPVRLGQPFTITGVKSTLGPEVDIFIVRDNEISSSVEQTGTGVPVPSQAGATPAPRTFTVAQASARPHQSYPAIFLGTLAMQPDGTGEDGKSGYSGTLTVTLTQNMTRDDGVAEQLRSGRHLMGFYNPSARELYGRIVFQIQ